MKKYLKPRIVFQKVYSKFDLEMCLFGFALMDNFIKEWKNEKFDLPW